jgi:hypothetical protein
MKEQDKKKETPALPKSPPTEKTHRDFSGRILDSASGLLRDSFSPTSTQPASTLANFLASEGKAGSSTASSNTEPGTTSGWRSGIKGGQSLESRPNAANGFRELSRADEIINARSSHATGGLSLDQFMSAAQDGTEVPTWQHSSADKGKQVASGLNGYHAERPASNIDMSATWDVIAGNQPSQTTVGNGDVEARGTNGIHGAAKIDEADGADMLKLLQDPTASFWTYIPEEDTIPYMISEADMRVAEDIVRRVDMIMASRPGRESTMSAAPPDEPFSRLSSFFDEIMNYQDEVWGYARPIIEEARRIVEEAKREGTVPGSTRGEEGPATRRLRMILAHVDGSR